MRNFLLLSILFTSACSTMKPIRTESSVDLDAFMGDWYVVANIPTFLEKEAWNAVESYERGKGNRIETTFTFNKGGPDGELKTYTPVGFVREEDPSNAVWGMRFVWPVKAEYIIMYVDEDYQETMIGRSKRDYLWIMARQPDLPEERIQALIDLAVEEGYDRTKIQRVPHAVPTDKAP
ncbi:MAG: lipocalin family protein [Kiritimatiellia bacterium]